MTMNSTRVPGLRFRIRHLLILVVYFAILLAVMVPMLRMYGRNFNPAVAILLISPWLLGGLVWVLERKGPVKYWAAPVLLSLTCPAIALTHDWVLLYHWRESGAVPNVLISLLVNTLLIGGFTYFLASIRPDHCPRCGHRALIPLLRPLSWNSRTAKTRWCGSCGAQYWRLGKGVWQKERRVTWVDNLNAEQQNTAKTHKPPKPLGLRTDRSATQPKSTPEMQAKPTPDSA